MGHNCLRIESNLRFQNGHCTMPMYTFDSTIKTIKVFVCDQTCVLFFWSCWLGILKTQFASVNHLLGTVENVKIILQSLSSCADTYITIIYNQLVAFSGNFVGCYWLVLIHTTGIDSSSISWYDFWYDSSSIRYYDS